MCPKDFRQSLVSGHRQNDFAQEFYVLVQVALLLRALLLTRQIRR